MSIAYLGIVSAVLIEDEFPIDLCISALQSKNWWSTKIDVQDFPVRKQSPLNAPSADNDLF